LHPVEQPGQTDSLSFRNQTRILKRKSWLRRAPTGQTSARFPAYSWSIGRCSKVEIWVWSPRFTNSKRLVPVTSRSKRMQREQSTHRSASSMIGPRSTTFLFLTLSSSSTLEP
jgi:hypothetical protein